MALIAEMESEEASVQAALTTSVEEEAAAMEAVREEARRSRECWKRLERFLLQ